MIYDTGIAFGHQIKKGFPLFYDWRDRGVGLGLPVHKIILPHGAGSKQRALTEGTTFTITIPTRYELHGGYYTRYRR
jgi:signal transduction histidine kinase